jgi:hypothetical protein
MPEIISFIKRDADEPGGGIFSLSGVEQVLGPCRYAKIFSAIIEGIAVSVVNKQSGRLIHNQSLQTNHFEAAVFILDAAYRVKFLFGAIQ